MKISKKILVLFFVAISLGLFASFLPVKTSSTPSVKAETTVAKIYNKITSGWNTYTTLESAISASASGGIIVLSADYTINAEIVLSKNITIVSDNNSKLTKSFYGTMFTVPQGYTLTFGSITDTYYGLTLTNIYLDGQSSYDFSGPFVNNKGQLYLNKQCVVQNAYMSSYDSSAILNKSGVLTANGAKFINNNGNNETEGVIKSTYVSGSTEPNNSFIDCYFEKNNGNTIYAEDNCTFTLTDCTFKNNNQLVFRRGPANVTITGCTFNNNIITIDEIFSEGLIDYECQNGGYLKLNGCNFTYNQADKGIYSYFNCVHFAYGEQLLVTECEFAYNYGNTINVVGASASSNSNVEITNSLIYSNETNSILSLTNATANIEDCSIKNNTPESTATSSSNGSININTSIVTIKNTELNNNISTLPSSGSQIYVEENSVLNLEECTIKNGEYATDVKAVYLTKNSGLNLKTSNEIGGTIYLESDTTNSLNPSISIADDYQYSSSSYTLDFSNPELYNEQDEVYAVQFSDSVNWGAFTVSTDGYYLIRGKSSNILNNMYAAKAVAKIYTSTGWAYYDTLSSAVAFAQAGDTIVVFEDCVVEGTIDVDKNLTIVSDNNSKITKSHTYEIFNVVDCTLTIGNQNTTYQGLTLTDIYIDGNKDEVSSVEPLIKCEGNLNLYSGCYIQNNNNTYSQIITPENPSNAAGVAIYGAQSILNIFGAKIVGNTSAKRGAGIWAYGIANILIDSAHFAYNTATEGAALYCKNSQSLILNNCKFNNNNVTNNSGVLYVTSENKYIANISNTEFVSNQGFATCYLVFIKANITNCSVTNSSRLGMYFDGAEGTVSNCYFAGNEEYAIRKSGGNISVIGSVIEENSAGINAQGSMTINYCTITNNNGVGVTGSASASLTILNSEISNNANGGISFDTTGSLSVDNCKILGNSADTGAGIYINNGVTSIIKNTIISNNTATQNGSALYVGNSNNKLTLNSCSIYDNICESANGYGIYMGYGVNLTLENSNIISEVINVNYYLAYGPKPIIIAQNYDFADNTYKILATDATIYTEANSIQIIQFENAEELNLNKFVCLNDGYAFTKGTSTSNLNNLYLTTNVVAKIYDDSTSSWNYFSSLETAIQSAPNNSTIVFCGDDDYILSSTIQIDKNLTIVSDAEATITKSHTGALFNVASGYTLTIGNQNETYQGLTLTPITLSGDGDNITSTEPLLINFGTLNLLSGCYVQDNKNNGSYNGGGIYNQGILNIDGATIYYNIASALGGGIYNVGELTINNATIESNGSQNGGAGIFNVGSLTLNSTQISNNGIDYDGSHYGTGVAIYSVNGSLNIYNCTIKGNFSDTGFCIDATSNTVISGTTITDNDTLTTIRFETDGIKTLTITDCEIKNNYGYAVDCYSSTQSLAQSPVVIIKNSIITDNYDLGLIFNSYINALVENSEISRNDCTQVETYSDTILTLKETTLNLFEGETDVIVIAGTLKLINKNKINGDIFVAEATAKIVIESEYYYNDTIGLYFAEPELYLTTSIVEFANLDEVNINAFTCSNVGYRLVQGTTEDTNNKLYLSNKFTFTYNHNSPELTNNVVEYAYGATITPIANPTRNHYTFAGWYTEAECETEYTFTTMPANDVTVYAKWEKATYTITATANAGGTITPNGEATYNYLDTQTYTIVANTGYAVK
ncbi:MAG: hypothetical protein E7376_02050, partial [Clostridiales bacterium]|nr:hypothetical protein [Clostridiales bacterium]